MKYIFHIFPTLENYIAYIFNIYFTSVIYNIHIIFYIFYIQAIFVSNFSLKIIHANKQGTGRPWQHAHAASSAGDGTRIPPPGDLHSGRLAGWAEGPGV